MSILNHLLPMLKVKLASENSPIMEKPFQPKLPSELDDEDACSDLIETKDEDLNAEGQSFAICYENARGIVSERRITVWGLERTIDDKLLMRARCAETKKIKSFRADRVKYCIDLNGEVFEPADEFLAEIFGLSHSQAALIKPDDSNQTSNTKTDPNYLKSKRVFRSQLILMSAMAESDGKIDACEASVAIKFVDSWANNIDISMNESSIEKLERYFKRIRPDEEMIVSALEAIAGMPIPSQIQFISACAEVMRADGYEHEAELLLLQDIREQLFGC